MIGPELQVAIVTALKAAPALCDGRIYDNPPTGAAFPYITVGDDQVLDDSNSCAEGWEAYPDIHVWSRPAAKSKLEMKGLAAAIVTRLSALDGVAGFIVVSARLETFRSFRDPDGITEHGVVTMRYLLDPA